MRPYLLDTSVLSLLEPNRPVVPPGFVEWARSNNSSLFASTMSIAEIEQGIAKLQRKKEGRARAEVLASWCERLIAAFGSNFLPLDVAIARETGALSDALRAKGVHPGLPDVVIGATARVHGLDVLTYNERHFALLKVPFFKPAEILAR